MPCRPYYQSQETRDFLTNARAETFFGPLRRLVLVAAHVLLRMQPNAASQPPPRDLSFRVLLVMGSSAPAPTPETVVYFALSSSRRSNSCSLGRAVLSSLGLEIVVRSAKTVCSALRCGLIVAMCVSTDAID
jgi:hypothetical protein